MSSIEQKQAKQNSRAGRLTLLDSLRGAALVSMILYHGTWDLVYMAGVRLPWYSSLPGYLWQQSICLTFILVSGYCAALAGDPQRLLRRGLIVSACGLLVTVVTLLLLPEDRVVFGVLTLIGAGMLITGAVRIMTGRPDKTVGGQACHHTKEGGEGIRGDKTGIRAAGFGLSLAAFLITRHVNNGYLLLGIFNRGIRIILPRQLYSGLFMTFLGFTDPGFFSTDYFSLLPWYAWFLSGYFLRGILRRTRAEEKLQLEVPVLAFMGRHSLPIYLLHQPVLFLLLTLLGKV